MNNTKKILAAAIAMAVTLPAVADNHEDDEGYMLSIMDLTYQHGHGMKFRDALRAYKDCYAENDGENGWSAWSAVDGEPNRMYIVGRIDMWADLGEDDPARQACWPEHGQEITSHISSANRRMWRFMPDWSGDNSGYNVVRVHNFRVGDGEAFREVVGEIAGHMKAADAEHMGNWFQAVGQQRWGADYMVVAHYEDFAAMDEDRKGANDYLVDAVGEEAAEATWEKFRESMAEMEPYWTQTLARSESLGYSPGGD
ncbi:MAG: hypothetical protein R3323_10165 [Wenzhouxiangellaceae bacterium]|nr:hypothetical protein [Wenzhouxiangellaceae bacterium]